MKILKRASSAVLLLILVMSLAACGKDTIVGTWSIALSETVSEEFTFDKDGNLTISVVSVTSVTEGYTYEIDGNKLILVAPDGSKVEATYEIKDNKLIVTEGEEVETFDRK